MTASGSVGEVATVIDLTSVMVVAVVTGTVAMTETETETNQRVGTEKTPFDTI